MHELFQRQAAATPDNIAVSFQGILLTYREANLQANRLAHCLRSKGVGPNTLVGLSVPRCTDFVIGILAILKAGGAYLPLDPSYPAGRLEYMAQDAKLAHVLATRETAGQFADTLPAVTLMDGGAEGLAAWPDTDPPGTAKPGDLMYVVYTSGSTGKPKGVMVSHANVTRLFPAASDYLSFGPSDVWSQVHAYSFGFSVWEIWGPLLYGGRLAILPDDTVKSPEMLLAAVCREGVTVLSATPSLFRLLVWADESTSTAQALPLRYVVFSGEPVQAGPLRRWFMRHGEDAPWLVNMFAITETAGELTFKRLLKSDADPANATNIGMPLSDVRLHLLDGRLDPVADGQTGELFVGGQCVALGYLGSPALTQERFIPDPFSPNPSARLYRTGDLAKKLATGEYAFQGRADRQIKVRGFRVDPAEIQAVLCRHPAVQDALVAAQETGGEAGRIIAYLQARQVQDAGSSQIPNWELRQFAARHLPGHMVPSGFVWLERFPLTANGKLDFAALPVPGRSRQGMDAPFCAPRTALEKSLAQIWGELLAFDEISAQDNFFELGGHSLLATQVASRLRQSLGIEVPVRTLLEMPVLADLAAHLEFGCGGSCLPPLSAADRSRPLPLSYAQQRLWFLSQMGVGSAYNMPAALRLRGPLDIPALQQTLTEVVHRHESLRTTFEQTDADPVQIIHADPTVELPLLDWSRLPQAERETLALQEAQAEVSRPFALDRDGMLRAKLLRLAEDEHVLLLTTHHIASDGWSVGVLVRELSALYPAFLEGLPPPLPALPVQYADFAVWQRQWLQGEVLARQLDYWKSQLDGVPPLMALPTDRPRPPVESFRAGQCAVSFGAGLSNALKALSRLAGTTLFTTLLAAFQVLLARYSGMDDIVVGAPVANRNRLEVEPLIGFFVNTLALRADLSGNPGFKQLLRQVKQTALDAQDHQDLPFERLVEELKLERKLSHNPLVQVVFALQTAQTGGFALPGLEVKPFDLQWANVRLDLELHLWEKEGGLAGFCVYAADLFDESTISRMMGHFETLLAGIAADPSRPVRDLPIITAQEQQQLIAWNQTASDYPQDKTIVDLFDAQVERTPDNIAVVFEDESLTYRQLNERANRLAHHLLALETPDGKALLTGNPLVAIAVERSFDMVIGLLAILKAGGAYVPVDPSYPPARIQYMLEDSAAPLLLTQSHLQNQLALGELAHECAVLCLDEVDLSGQPTVNLTEKSQPHDLAYVIFTSGSTGKPKGVMIEHESLVNLCTWHIRAFSVHSTDRATLLANSAFDASVWELWPYMMAGASVMPADIGTLMETNLWDKLNDNDISISFLPTPIIHNDSGHSAAKATGLRLLLTGGDRLLHCTSALPCPLINNYGPTENTVVTTSAPVHPYAAPSIGRPIDNVKVYVLDAWHQPLPIGIPGELCIAGAGLARGYLNRPELTAEKFIELELFGKTERVYKTGDLARWLPDGNLEFLGRIDHQIKLRGFRIELGEIESVLRQHPAVREAVALVREDARGDKHIVAYLVTGAVDGEISAKHVSEWQALYEETYGSSPPGDAGPILNFVGWNSSYTGQPIPESAMREWLGNTVAEVRSLHPLQLLEIGCGTGLLLSSLAAGCERYVGTDYSEAALDAIRHSGPFIAGFDRVSLYQRMADDFSGFGAGEFDGVVLNSVIQYFTGVDYLLRVLEGAAERVRDGGFIYVGDVRSLPLLEAYHASVQAFQAESGVGREKLRQRVREFMTDEEELLIDPAFFHALRKHIPRITGVGISLKRGLDHNELTRFRYQVILHIGDEAPVSTNGEDFKWQSWMPGQWTPTAIRHHLSEAQPLTFALRGVPNDRLREESAILNWLAGGGEEQTLGELRQSLSQYDDFIDPEELWVLAEETGYQAHIGWSAQGLPGAMDVLFQRSGQSMAWMSLAQTEVKISPWQHYANNPLLSKLRRVLIPKLREFLHARLPEYMIPQGFVVLDTLPLTLNGKLDRKALPEPGVAAGAQESAPPITPSEQCLSAIWSEVLGLEQIGRFDNFFELGGHSLLATQLVARIRENFKVELPIRSVFEHPQLSELAVAIDASACTVRLPPIEAQADDARKVLSFAQQRLWFLNQFEGQANATYNLSAALRLAGPLHVEALKHSLQWLLQRHESLRSCFPAEDGQATLRILPLETFEALRNHDLRHLVDLPSFAESASSPAAYIKEIQTLANTPFDLGLGPLFKADLLLLDDNQYVLLINMHHSVSDGWSIGVFIRDWQHAYTAFAQGGQPNLPPLAIQYSDYAAWQRQWFQGEVLEAQVAYWAKQLDGLPELLELPTDKPRPPQQSYRGAHVNQCLPSALSQAVNTLSRQHGVTVFMALLAAFNILLSRYSRSLDISVGSPIANRTHSHTEDLIGFFVNTLVLRSDCDPQQSFIELLHATRQTCLEAYAHQDLPFEMLVEKLQPTRSMSHSPLFQVMFVLQNNDTAELALPGLQLGFVETEYPVAKFDLTLSIAEQDGQFHCYWEYATDLFEAETVERMAAHFEVLLDALSLHPQQAIGRAPMLTEDEIQQLQAWNDTETNYPKDQSLVDLFEAQVQATPNNIAVVFEGESLTYWQLNALANQLAHYLLGLAKPDGQPLLTNNPLIAIAVERSLDMVIGLLAILKAGGAYVPIDPSYPAARIRYMLDDSAAVLLLTQSHLTGPLSLADLEHDCLVLCLDQIDVAGQPSENLPTRSTACDLAYVIYTSGSTGKPKGVMIENRGLVNLALAQISALDIDAESRVLQFASFSFDASLSEITTALLTGASLHLVAKETLLDAAQLAALIVQQQISHITLPPSYLSSMAEQALSGLQTLVVAGEACPAELPKKWAEKVRFINAYGPTENTVCASVALCFPAMGTPHIGQPIANTRIYILDALHQPQPSGIPGELCIAGAGLARGYLNRPDLTAEKFIEAELFGKTERIYKTGDLARWLPDGNLEFLGRIDHQVKLRGFRIELGEIEAVLGQFEYIKEAVVNLYEADGNKRLVAYIVVSGKQAELDVQASPSSLATDHWQLTTSLGTFLQSRLPDYMVPAHFVVLERLPLTPNGKVDRKALPAPNSQNVDTAQFVPPRTSNELILAQIWSKLLKVGQVGAFDSFFALGGHSLLVTQLVYRIEEAFSVLLPVRSLFDFPTLAELAEHIEQAGNTSGLDNCRKPIESLADEVQLDSAIQPPTQDFIVEADGLRSIFLTGGTGFLGTYLLWNLLEHTSAQIYCLVRTANPEQGRRRLQMTLQKYGLWSDPYETRIVPVLGDLAEPRFGLSREQFNHLAIQIDAIYHNGALTNFIYPYSLLKSANVLSTQEALRLASHTRTKPLHYVSTLSVFPLETGLALETDLPDSSALLQGGYSQSKWVAEKIVHIAHERGLPVTIHRPSRICGITRNGYAHVDDMFYRWILTYIQQGITIDVDGYDFQDNLVPVDYASRALVHLSFQRASLGKTFHLSNTRSTPWSIMLKVLAEMGYAFDYLPPQQWQAEIVRRAKFSPDVGLHPLLPLLSDINFDLKEIRFDCRQTLDGLVDTGITCPTVNAEMLKSYFSYLLAKGFLPPIRAVTRPNRRRNTI